MNNLNLKLCPIILSAILLACVFTACQKPETKHSTNSVEPPKAPTGAASSIKVEMKTEPMFVEAGKEVRINFTLKNDKDEVIKDLPATPEKPLRLIAVSEDLSEFYDLRPKLVPDGSYQVQHTFPAGGRYTFFLDLTLPDGKQETQILGFGVAGDSRPKQELKAADLKVEIKAGEKFIKTADGLQVEMKPDGELIAGKPVALNFDVTGKTTNKPPENIGELINTANFIIVSEDLKEFVRPNPDSGRVELTFPKGGLYKIWAQFLNGEKNIAVSFVVNVKAAEGEADYSKVEIPKGAIKVTVSKEGYTPKAIEIKVGQPATLAFIRIDNENCGQELVFPSLNIKKELPLGKVVTVDIPAEKPGEFNFACGMNMLKGIVMVY